MAGATRINFPGLVEPAGLVVGFLDRRQRRQYRGLVPAVPRTARTAGRPCRRRVRHRADAAALRRLCVRLRLPLVPAARGCAADLPVRPLAVERRGRPVGRDRGRDLLRGAVGDHPLPARHDDGSGHHLERRMGDRAADPDRGMFLLVCGADHQLSRQCHREFDMGGCLLRHRHRALPVAAGVRRRRFARSSPSRSSGLPAIWCFS